MYKLIHTTAKVSDMWEGMLPWLSILPGWASCLPNQVKPQPWLSGPQGLTTSNQRDLLFSNLGNLDALV